MLNMVYVYLSLRSILLIKCRHMSVLGQIFRVYHGEIYLKGYLVKNTYIQFCQTQIFPNTKTSVNLRTENENKKSYILNGPKTFKHILTHLE